MDQVGVVDLEGLADVLNGNGEDGGTYRDLHAVHDRHGQGIFSVVVIPCRDHW